MAEINLVGVLVAGIAAMIVGMVWYSKALFGNRWMQLTGNKGGDMKMAAGTMIAAFIMALLSAYVLAYFLNLSRVSGWMNAAMVAFWAWLGFVLPLGIANGMFQKENKELTAINLGHHLVGFLVMAIVLALV